MLTGGSTAVDRLSRAVDDLAAEDIDQLADGALGVDLVALRRLVDRIEADFIRRLERFDAHKGALAEGAVSTVSWLRAGCGLTGAGAGERVRMARTLADLPETTTSFRAGRAGFVNVSLISRLAGEVGAEAVRSVESTLAPVAETLDARRMHYLVAFTRHRLDADGALDAENRHHDRRWFACDQVYGGVWVLRGELDAENGAIAKTALDALSSPTGPDDPRLGSQRRADALVELAARRLQNGPLATAHGARPQLILTADIATLQGRPGAPPADLIGAGPIPAPTARRLACDSALTLATTAGGEVQPCGSGDGPGSGEGFTSGNANALPSIAQPSRVEPLSIGRASRTIPAAIRTALVLRDRGCRFPGCDRPPDWTDGHHVLHWADWGETEVANLMSLCRLHHRMAHEGGWTVAFTSDGSVVATPPATAPPNRSP